MKPLRRIGAVLAALVVCIILSNGTDAVLRAVGVFPPWPQPMLGGMFALAAAYRTVYNVITSYIAARLAPDRPVAHAMALAAVGSLLGIVATVFTWSKGPSFGPHWYPLVVVAVAFPCAWLGSRPFARQPVPAAA
jgi:hypothetical protein